MESKNIYIILAVVIVLGGGFFAYRHFSKDKSSQAHHEDTYARLTEMANKSPRAGLIQMGRALQKYYEAMNAYPNSLSELYPDYISGKSFIENVNWNYRASGNNFALSKSVQRGGQTLVASIDKTLKAKMGAGTRVASATRRRPTPPPAASSAGAGRPKVASGAGLKLPTGMELLATLKAPTIDTGEDASETLAPVREEARIVSVDEAETPSELAASVASNYLVWRDEEGNLGFGNVQLPSADRFDVASASSWFKVKRTVNRETENVQAGKEKLNQKQIADALAFNMQNEYLAWKDTNGRIGFGNVQYPAAKQFSVPSTDEWVDYKLSKPEPAEDETLSVMPSQEKPVEDIVHMGIQGQYMAWRDKNGNIGFGNVQYPGMDNIEAVYVDGAWQKFERDKSL